MYKIVNLYIVFKIISSNLFIISAALLFCVPIALHYDEQILPFIFSSIIIFFSGLLFYLVKGAGDKNPMMQSREAFLSVTLSWFIISLLGCLPYILSGAIPSFVNAFFESVSGFTTTGSSILTDIESLPKSILFWRSLTHWIGGIGIIVLVIIIMPKLHIGGYHMFTLESSLQEKILPQVKSISLRLLGIYIFLTALEMLLLLYGDMNLFESVCHSFGTIATGGFSPKNDSISGYSPYIQYVIMVFMFLAGINFVIHYYLIKRKLDKIRENEELKFYLYVLLFTGLIITATLFFKTGRSLEISFRESFFQVISIFTSTGYATADYMQWPVYAWLIIFLAMFVGGCTGSTAGGIKMARHLILIKNVKRIFRRLLHPDSVIPLRLNNRPLNDQMNSSILSFISVYILLFIGSSVLLVITGLDIQTALGSVASCLACMGPGIGSVGPAGNYEHLSGLAKIILPFLMLFGRLEIFPILILFTRGFWRD